MLSRLSDYLFAALFGTFQRMIFWELARVFLLCLCALAGIFTLLAVLQQLQFGASLAQALRMLPLLVPTSVPWITPPACLFASCVVYGRMSHDNEAVALKAAGVDLLSVIRPAMLLGAFAAAFTAYLQFDVTPQALRGSREVLLEEPEETIALVLKRKQTLEFLSGENLLKLSVRDVQDQRLLGVVVKQRKATAKTWEDPDSVTRIHSAVLRVDQAARKVQLADHQQMETWVRPGDQSKAPQGSGSHSLEGKALEFDLPPQFSLESLRVENASNPGMLEWAKLPTAAAEAAALAARHDLYATRLAKLPAEPLTDAQVKAFHDEVGIHPAADPAVRLKQADDNRNHRDAFARRDRIMRYEYHLRPAIAGGCLLFVVLGCPVGLWANRADYLSIFVICFLPALLVYYPILFMVGGYARDGRLPMALGVWTANAALAVGTVVLAWRLIRR